MTVAAAQSSVVRFRAMNTDVTLHLVGSGDGGRGALSAARQVFVDVETACTRFDPTSPLMRANEAGADWYRVPPVCFEAICEAASAHVATNGLFEPRVLDVLLALGYDRTLPFEDGPVQLQAGRSPAGVPKAQRSPPPAGPTDAVPMWQPGLDRPGLGVRIGPRPIDLGGIGKGLAVRRAARLLEATGQAFLVEAGGDCALGGGGPDGDGWKVGVEDPLAGDPPSGTDRPDAELPVAVLSLSDTGCATSSLRRRAWTVEGHVGAEQVHHIVDPRTGRSAAGGLRSVTVVLPDPARAEVWSKSLLIAGRHAIAGLAADRGLAALWVDDEGRLGLNRAMAPHVIWRSDR